jgi:hypothetical protein
MGSSWRVVLVASLTLAGTARAQPQDAAAALRALLSEAWEEQLREDPLLATSVGDHR